MARYAVVAGPSFDGSWDVERLGEMADIDVITLDTAPEDAFYDTVSGYETAVVLGAGEDAMVAGIQAAGTDVLTTAPYPDVVEVDGVVEALYARDDLAQSEGIEQEDREEPYRDVVEGVLSGEHRALARAITLIEDRSPGYRGLVSELYGHADGTHVVGVTGSPGAGKSTLVDRLACSYRAAGYDVGVIAVDPVSPFTEGAVLGDRIRMGSVAGDMDVFFRSMSARGNLGGVSAATTDAVTALDAFGKDRIIIETVGAGQNEVDIARTADTVNVVVQPQSGDDVQMLKAGILEIGDVYTVNKADLPGVDRTVRDLQEMIHLGDATGSHRRQAPESDVWTPPVVETVATDGAGIDDMVDAFNDHATFLDASGAGTYKERERHAETIRMLLQEDVNRMVEDELEACGGVDALVDTIMDGEADPYSVVDGLLEPDDA